MPDAHIERNGQRTHLQQSLSVSAFTLLLCGPLEDWTAAAARNLADRYAVLMEVRYLSRERAPDILVDDTGDALAHLGLIAVNHAAQFLVRPDGYIAFRCAGCDLGAVERFIAAVRR